MPNIITAPRYWKNKAILVKTEVSYGTDPTPTGAANWIEARNVQLDPFDVETQARNIEMPWMGSSGSTIVSQWGKLSFDFLMAGSGAAGTAPKWAPLVMACGMAETISAGVSAAYNLVSAAFSSVTCWINIDGVYHKFVGSRGDLQFKGLAKGIPVYSISLACVYAAPTTVALPAVTRTGWQVDEGMNSVNTTQFTLNAIDFAFSTHNWSLGNRIARINLPGPQLEIAVTDRGPSMDVTVLAPPLATFDPFALATAGTNVAASFTHGSAAGRKVKHDYKVVIRDVDYDQIEDMVAYKLTLDPTPVSGNDEITITAL
jgi:hypothetical protein